MRSEFPSRLDTLARLPVGGGALGDSNEWEVVVSGTHAPMACRGPVHTGAALGNTGRHIWFFFDDIF